MPTIEFHAYSEDTLLDFKPVLAKSISPEWWKKMKVADFTTGVMQQTLRACPAMDDWLKSGWIIVANRDIHVLNGTVGGDKGEHDFYTWDSHADVDSSASTSHPKEQFRSAFEYHGHGADGMSLIKDAFKMRCPWNIKTPPGYSCFYLDPFLFQNEYFATWQGIIDTDKFNVGMDNSQIIFYPKVDHSFVIKKGTPICQIIPYKREEWVASYEVKSSKHWTDARSHYTADWESTPYSRGMQEWGQDKEFEDPGMREFGPYRKRGYWQEKSKFFKEDGKPPTECPFDPVTGKMKEINTEETSSEIQLELDLK